MKEETAMNIPELELTPGSFGWSASLPNSPRLFGQNITVEIHTRLVPYNPVELPPISARQAALVQQILSSLSALVQRVESELIQYHQSIDPEFQAHMERPHIWLSSEHDDGISWTFVVGIKENPDFGYHAEFEGTEFIELWAGD